MRDLKDLEKKVVRLTDLVPMDDRVEALLLVRQIMKWCYEDAEDVYMGWINERV